MKGPRWWPLTARGTGAVALAVASFLVAHEFAVTELLYVSALLLIVTAVSLTTLYLGQRGERISRVFVPDVVAVGDEATVRVHVEVRAPLPMRQGRWRDRLEAGLTGNASDSLPASASGMGSGRDTVLSYRLRAHRRGVRAVGPLQVATTDPFGFARRTRTIGATTPLTVTPAIVDLEPLAELPGAIGGSRHAQTNELGQGSDNLIPRTYVSGDSMRRIHWRASAHRDELMVRQEEQESTPEATVVFDRSRRRYGPAAGTPGRDAAFETAVSATVSVVARLVRKGYSVTVLDADGRELVDPVAGDDAAEVEAFAVRAATLTTHDDVAAADVLRAFAGATLGPLVLVTGTLEPADEGPLPALGHHSTLPVLLTVGTSDDDVRALGAGGWHAASLRDGDVSAAWSAALRGRRAHVLR
ncbi:DUF58 domain-containing protein [Microbacterium sp.]|uniref:DUF58 domain-containing protein n=1 Tax=Microbacterium sp. TaxID=51671 RepID=UPI003A8546E0